MGSGKKSARVEKERDVLVRMAIDAQREWLESGVDPARPKRVYRAVEVLAREFEISIPNRDRIRSAADVEARHRFLQFISAQMRRSVDGRARGGRHR